jgi:hypothetical protein
VRIAHLDGWLIVLLVFSGKMLPILLLVDGRKRN